MTPKTLTRKLPEMTAEVASMISLRHSAEQRGNFSPLGRLQWMRTEHGLIRFPAINGDGCGPDIAVREDEGTCNGVLDELIVLGHWEGLPALRVNTSKPCPKCRHACHVCGSSGKKLCELCGGAGTVAGNWLPCPGPGCVRDTGGFANGGKIAANCITCGNSGQVKEQNLCAMCEGSKQMTCSQCAGTGKYSTGRANGAVDWEVSPRCKFCDGTTFVGEWKRQDEAQFMNATLLHRDAKGRRKAYRVLGPIREFAIRDPHSLRSRIFDVSADSAGDLLVLLVPRSKMQKPQKAYLVGGVVRERDSRMAVGA